ncbi:MFS transporter [Aeromicrobium sp. 636]|uniref:MFS transporter n=1 Tax=Aeromicrobium senzhongii TaxID=2663859 RepID=A0A8I0K341_9ACTN|nr:MULTISPECIES: MFS transporter [Aeromicrobium]MBC9227454.1 MFS transporter [Aeromicrobium senzhongii]MCQ3999551.1 MFS transporter [Aeromicrobium sp. 636]
MSPNTTRRRADRPTRTSGATLVCVLALLSTVTALLQTMAVPVLGKMSRDLEVSTAAIGWVVTINLLAAAVLTPVLSKSGDLHGRRRLVLVVVVAVAAGSLLAAATSSYWLLLVARAVQGASFCLFPLSVGILRDHLAPQRLPLGLSFLTGAISVGAGAGLVLTGILTHGDRDYRNIFWFTLTVALVLLVLALVVIPRDRPHRTGRVDWTGGFLLGVALILLLLAMTQGNDWGWASVTTVGCLVGAVVTFAVWLTVENRVREPLVPIAMLRDRTLASANAIGFFIGFGMFLIFLAITALVQVPESHGHGFSASVLETSLVYLLPAASIGIIASPLGGMWVSRFGGRATLLVSSVVGLLGYLQLLAFHDRAWQVIMGGVITNAAFSMGFAAVPAVVTAVVRPHETALANAMASITRSAGSALGSALVVALIAGHLMPDDHPHESVFVIVFSIGAATMALSILITAVGIPRRQDVAAQTTGRDPRPTR